MARIAIMLGVAAVGAVTAGLGAIPFFPALGGIGATLAAGGAASAVAGGLLGLTVGNAIGTALFPAHLPNQFGPHLSDLLTSTSTPGGPIPILYGESRFAGEVIWSPGGLLESTTTTTVQSKDGGVTQTTYSYFCSLAVSFCEGEADIEAIWADGKELWVWNEAPSVGTITAYDSHTTYTIGDVVSWTAGNQTVYYVAVQNVPAGQSPGLIFIFGNQFWTIYNGPFAQSGTYTKVTSITTYPGTPNQEPDPTILAANEDSATGVNANTPAFRNQCYVVVADLLLRDFGNRVPNFTGLVKSRTPRTLDAVLADLCNKSDIATSDQDFSAVSSLTVHGYVVSSPTDARTCINQLAQSYFFDVFESDFKLKAKLRDEAGSSVLTVPESDLGLASDNAKLDETIIQSQELPVQVEVTYLDAALLWQQGKQLKQRHHRSVKTKNRAQIELPMVLSPTEAVQVAEQYLYLTWLERKPWHTNLFNAKYMVLDPSDIFQFVYQGNTYTVRMVRNTIGQNFTMEVQAVSHDENAYTSTTYGGGSTGLVLPGTQSTAVTLWWLMDIPYLQDGDAQSNLTGYYWVISSTSSPYPGGVLLNSFDNTNFNNVGGSVTPTPYGVAQDTLGDPPSLWTWDEVNTLDVQMGQGAPSSTTDENVYDGANVASVMRADGSTEIIQFANADLTGTATDGTGQPIYTLSRLLRGRRNTEYAAFNHTANESVLFLPTGLQRTSGQPLSFVGRTGHYKAATLGQDPSGVTSTVFTSQGNDLKPASPVHIRGARDGSNNLTIGWTRRTRYGGRGLVGPTPLNEDSEVYQIDVLSGLTVVRTIAWVSGTYDSNGLPEASYTAAQQTADGLTPGNPVTVAIYQISGEVGRGQSGNATI